MQSSAPEAVDLEQGDRRHQEALRHRRAADRRLRPQVPAGPPAGGARRALHPTLLRHQHRRRLGRRPQRSAGSHTKMCKKTDQPIAGAADRPEGARACSIRRWSSGAASSAARRSPRARRAATIILTGSACGWPARAFAAGRCSGRATISACAPQESPFNVHDVNATILRLIGMDHTRLTYLYQSRDMRLTDVHGENEFTNKLVG